MPMTNVSQMEMGKGVQQQRAGVANSAAALYHPKVFKHRFCASFPKTQMCKRGATCAFAHSREEIRTELLTEKEESHDAQALTDEFFTLKFKTLWCPIGKQHDW